MIDGKARRFWSEASVDRAASGAGFVVRLDARQVNTPGKQPLVVPSRALAEAIAAEWQAQEEVIDPRAMPFTRMANSALEKVTPQRAEVAAMLAGYGDSDLTCYRADTPEGLVARQATAWDPLLDWAEANFGARLIPLEGVMYQAQPEAALAALAAPVMAMDPFELTGFHDLVALSGSLVVGLAARAGHLPIDDLWARSRVDEIWQIEQWGADDEAAEVAAAKADDFRRAAEFLQKLKD